MKSRGFNTFFRLLVISAGVVVLAGKSSGYENEMSGQIYAQAEPVDETDEAEEPADQPEDPPPPPAEEDIRNPDRYRGHPFDMGASDLIDESIEFDEEEGVFRKHRSVDGEEVADPEEVPMDEFIDQEMRDNANEYFRERAEAQSSIEEDRAFRDLDLGPDLIERFLDGDLVEVSPNISAELTFAGDFQRVQNPEWSIRQQRQRYFKFDQSIQMNVRANIGDRINFNLSYDTEASFDFDNQINLDYAGDEDDIIQSIEAGDVSMPLRGSLIKGSQSLFGLKTEMKFGNLTVTSVVSQQQSETENIRVEDGAQIQEFDISASNYDANRHFFLAHHFRENYNSNMSNPPTIRTQARITRLDVWVTNRRAETENTRNVVAFMDLGEPDPFTDASFAAPTGQAMPGNNANEMFQNLVNDPRFRNNNMVSQALQELSAQGIQQGRDYQRIENARKLPESDYDFHPQLGYISLNRELQADEVLAVAFEYTIGDQTFQVGDFSRDVPPDQEHPKVLFLKKLKGISHRPTLPIWDLMMKNVYFLGSRNINRDEFRFDVVYYDDQTGSYMDFLPEPDEPNLDGRQLIRVLGFDRLNRQREAQPDGVFDYIEGVTINPRTGRVYFPVIEPFGNDLRAQFNDQSRADRYLYQAIYDSTQFIAKEQSERDNFYLRGYYRGEKSDEINIEAVNIPEGSVRVTSGGMPLQENVHYTVDYTLGRVRIIDESILNSGEAINVSVEKSDMFSIQKKTLLGTRLDYTITDNFSVGGTFMHLNERPVTRRIALGDEPMTNSIWGVDGAFSHEFQWATTLLDRLPFYDTNVPSEISLEGEFAHLIPGHSGILGEGGTSYLDDFQASEKTINLKRDKEWYFASTPQYQQNKFPNADKINDLSYNFERALISWYIMDPIFYRNTNRTPDHIRNDLNMQSNHYMREVLQTELFPDKQIPEGVPKTLQTMDIAFYPRERGIYNYNVNGLDEDGFLRNPERKWGGIMRSLETTDFESANVEYIEFWMMDPFIDNPNASGGDFYINLGHISEDILRDGRKSFESGLPTSDNIRNVDTTAWGRVPTLPEVDKSFANDPSTRPFQDVGLDGLSTEDERAFFLETFLQPLEDQYGAGSAVYQQAFDDPSNDRFRFYLSSTYDDEEANIVERYKRYNKPEGNTPTSDQWEDGNPTAGRNRPDGEDISGDFTMNELEAYFQYHISLRPEDMETGTNYISDVKEATVNLRNGQTEEVKWYQFKIPVRSYDSRHGEIQDFRSVRFMRMFFHGFSEDIVTRFGEMQLVRGDWRRYTGNLREPEEEEIHDAIDPTTFDISTVSLEENASRSPIPYKMPPGTQRDIDAGSPYLTEKDERSLSLSVCNLNDNDTRAAFKHTNHDIRHHEYIRMFAHLEGQTDDLRRGDVWLILRLGRDQSNNYYEYAMPLEPTPHGAQDARHIWPEVNELNLRLEEFTTLKRDRDQEGADTRVPYSRVDSEGRGRITVRGNPSLDNIRMMMIGMRNPKQDQNRLGGEVFDDDGSSMCAEMWVNELRVTGFDGEGGWAATGRIRTKLADLGEVTLTGNRETIGFGSIEETLLERSREDLRGYNFTTQMSMGKVFPDAFGLEVPVYYSFSENIIRPKYNPLSPDVMLDHTLETIEEENARDSIIEISEDYESRRSFNISNMRIAPPKERNTRFYDIDNFNFTYAYSQIFNRDIRIEYNERTTRRGAIGYNYSLNPDPVTPFSGIGGGNWFNLVRDVNFYYLPQSVSLNAELNRDFREMMYRNTSGVESAMQPIFDKDFKMIRQYNLNHNLTRSIRLSYSATANTRIEEPPGPLDTEEKRNEVRDNVLSGGQMNHFLQNLNATYQLPLSKIPILDWTDATLSYQTSFSWREAPPANQELGHNIENSRTLGSDVQFDFVRLYNKNEFLRTVNQNRSNVQRLEREREREIRRMGENDEPPPEIDERRVRITERVSRGLMSLRNINVNYSITEGTQLPGYVHEPQYLGHDFNVNAPGLPFAFGSQEDIRPRAAGENWLTADTMQNNLFIKNYTENFQGQATIEPIRDFRINLDFNRRYSRNLQENFRADPFGEFHSFSPYETGNFSMSYYALPTAFEDMDDDHFTDAYRQMEESRRIIADRLAEDNPQSDRTDTITGFPIGYGPGHQDVLLNAFKAAYSGSDPSSTSLDKFPSIPLPNWRINYTGLSRIDWVQNYARSVSLNHVYRSNYTIGNYISTLNWDPDAQPVDGENLKPEYQVNQATITEQFSPFLGINITWVNDWSTRVEYQRTRTISMNFENFQMIESRNEDFIVGVGYRTTDLEIPFRIGGRRVILENEFNFRVDFTIRDNITVSRTIDQDQAQATRGSRIITINPEVDYMINDNLNIRLFFNRNITEPAVSKQHPTSFTNFGFSLRYNLSF